MNKLQFTAPVIAGSDAYGNIICEAVLEGLWPFKPKRIDLETYFDIDFNVHWLYAEALSPPVFKGHLMVSPHWRCFHREKLEDGMLFDPFTEMQRLYPVFRDAFRYRIHEDAPLHDKIFLGEN